MVKTERNQQAALEALRHQLSGKVTSGADLLNEQSHKTTHLSTTLKGLNDALGGGLSQGQLTEILSPSVSCGGGLVMAELLSQARRERRYAMLLDVGQGFTPESFPSEDLESLLWVGCDSARQAVEVLDVASRDENFHLFLVDLRDCEPKDWREVRSNLWYRVIGQLREREAVCVIFARSAVTTATKQRLEIATKLGLEAMDVERGTLLERTHFQRALGGVGSRDQTGQAGMTTDPPISPPLLPRPCHTYRRAS